MQYYTFQKQVQASLEPKLAAAGVPEPGDGTALLWFDNEEPLCAVYCDESHLPIVTREVEAYSIAAEVDSAQAARTKRGDLETQLDGTIQQLEDARTLLTNRAPTAAETRQILLLLVRCVLGVVRLLRNKL